MSARPKTVFRVRLAVAASKRPVSTQEVVAETGLSRNTVMEVLEKDALIRKVNERPALWVFDIPVPMPRHKHIEYAVVEPKEGWVPWTEKSRDLIPRLLKLDPRMPLKARKERVAVLEGMAQHLASLARDLEAVQNAPDWYVQLGGTIKKEKS